MCAKITWFTVLEMQLNDDHSEFSSLTDNVTVSRPMTMLDWCCQRAVHAARRFAASFSDNFRHESRSFVSGVAWPSFRTRASITSGAIGDAIPQPQNSTFVSWQVSSMELEINNSRRSCAVSLGLLDKERWRNVLQCVTSLQRPETTPNITSAFRHSVPEKKCWNYWNATVNINSWRNSMQLRGWFGVGLVIKRSLVRLPAGALSSQLGQLSLPSLWVR